MAIPQESTRAGTYVRQLTGEAQYRAFIPKPLPPDPQVDMDQEMWKLLSDADRALGRLDGVTEMLPNPNLFVAMYVRKEAVLSSQIEGTQASLVDILEFEADKATKGLPGDVGEVVNYVDAVNYGLQRLQELPLSLRLICEIHERLLSGVRGHERSPGAFRTSQNWIGPPGCSIADASFVPPPPAEMVTALGHLERFLHDESPMPVLLKLGLVHSQFETIHPFLDGNGRVGRLLITFLLCQSEVLRKPLLYLSYYFKRNRQEYYDRLMAVRTRGDWEGWLKFFLRGTHEVAHQATDTARAIISLREHHHHLVREQIRGYAGLRLLDILYYQPIITVKRASETLEISNVAANKLVADFEAHALLARLGESKRNRVFAYAPYLDLFLDRESPEVIIQQPQTTGGSPE